MNKTQLKYVIFWWKYIGKSSLTSEVVLIVLGFLLSFVGFAMYLWLSVRLGFVAFGDIVSAYNALVIYLIFGTITYIASGFINEANQAEGKYWNIVVLSFGWHLLYLIYIPVMAYITILRLFPSLMAA